MPAKKGLLHDGLSLPGSGAVLICWGKCTINTNALCSSIGGYKPAGLSTIVCLTENDCQGKQIFEKAYLNQDKHLLLVLK